MSRHFEGSFGSIRAIFPIEASEQNWGKNQNRVFLDFGLKSFLEA